MSHVDDDQDDIVLDEVADDDDEQPKREHQKEGQEKQQQPPAKPTPSSPPVVEEDDDTVVPVEEDYYSGPNKVLRLPLRVPSGSLLNSGPQVKATAKTPSTEMEVPPRALPQQTLSPARQPPPPPSPLLVSSSNVLFGFFRQLHCETCQLSTPLLVLLFAYLVALMYLALL